MRIILYFMVLGVLPVTFAHAEVALFDFPKSVECQIQPNGSSNCPSEDEIGREQSLLCIRRRGVPQECKIVSMWSCGLVSQNPSKICEVESSDVRARWRAEFIIRTLQAFEELETTPTSYTQARYRISNDPRMDESQSDLFSRVASQFFVDGEQCSGAATETAENSITPRADTKIEDIPQVEQDSILNACIYSVYCSLDAAARGQFDNLERIIEVRNTNLCVDVLRRVRSSPQANIMDSDTERNVRSFLEVISSKNPESDYLWAFMSATRSPEASGAVDPYLRMVWARPVFISEGIDSVKFFGEEVFKFRNTESISTANAQRLAEVLADSRINPENNFYILDMTSGFCGRAQYVIGSSERNYKVKVGRNEIDVVMNDDGLNFYVQGAGGEIKRHTISGMTYGFPNGELKPIWLGDTSVCSGTRNNLSQCRDSSDKGPFVVSLEDRDIIQGFIGGFDAHDIECSF